MHPSQLRIEDFTYRLPDEQIAKYPLPERDSSRLLIYDTGIIKEDTYRHIASHIPPDSLLVFNQTKVVYARLLFKKDSGSTIEVFCLEPHNQYPELQTALLQKRKVWWNCMVGGASKWKHGMVMTIAHDDPTFTVSATIVDKQPGYFTIDLTWDTDLTFAEVLHYTGKVPLPPYLHREAEAGDEATYQTIYAKDEGSVAAPTAGLHFTEAVFESLTQKGVSKDFVTLHVGAGTFKPVKSETMQEHDMHAEWIDVSAATIKNLLAHTGHIVAVGTTSMRTLESLYWIGVKLLQGLTITQDISVSQWDPYDIHTEITAIEALQAILNWLEANEQTRLVTRTQILIAPGYTFRIVRGLVTNFHQPQSTLLLLVSAIVGKEWRTIYNYALDNGFRFLSYGDGCLLWVP